jgi:methylthioribose-1-phosphate isomerase
MSRFISHCPRRRSTGRQRAAIPIERRDAREVTHIEGWTDKGRRVAGRLTPAAKHAFDVTRPGPSPH